MAAIVETLQALAGIVPQMPAKVREILEAAQTVDRAGIDFLNDLESKRGEAAQTVANLHQALADLSSGADGGKTQLESAAGAVEHDHEQLVSALDQHAQSLHDAVEAAKDGMGALEKELIDASTSAKDGESGLKEAVGQLGHAADTAADALETTVQSLVQEMHNLETALTDVKGQLSQGVQQVDNAAQTALTGAGDRLKQTLTSLHEMANTLSAEVQAQAGQIEAHGTEVAAAVKKLLEDEVDNKVHEALSNAHEAIATLKDVATQAASETQATAQTLETGFGELRQGLEPLPAGIQRLKQAVNDAGLSW